LFEEIKAFIQSIQEDTTPLVTGEDGLYALQTAETITSLIQNNLIKHYENV
jgi:predicted dehydrogenase